LDRGWSQRRTALVLYGVCACFGLLTLLFVRNSGQTTALVLFMVAVVIVLAVQHLRYHEVEELRAGVKFNVSDRRVRGANNITLRRVTRKLSETGSLTDLFDALAEVLETGEFARAVMIIGRSDKAEGNAELLERERSATASRSQTLSPTLSQREREPMSARMHEGMIYWHWVCEDLQPADPPDCQQLCAIRLPLASRYGVVGHLNLYRQNGSQNLLLDINYLCTLFREEVTNAVERILDQPAEPERKMAASA
jgi:hypothetical protein